MNRTRLLDLFCCQGGASVGYARAGFDVTGADKAREVMQMPWANRDGLREAIPPAYAEWVGRQIITHLKGRAAA